jgi:hypothetical protein
MEEYIESIISIARVCHEANKAFCEVNGDHTQKPWEDAEVYQRESAIKGVVFIQSGNSAPDNQHNSWMKEKIDNGWVYGEVKDPVAKTHPCIVPYDKLPEMQKKKDHLFIAIVKALS